MRPAAVLSGMHRGFFRRGLALCSLFPVVGSECILQSQSEADPIRIFCQIPELHQNVPLPSPDNFYRRLMRSLEVVVSSYRHLTPTDACTVLPALIDRTAGGRLYRAYV